MRSTMAFVTVLALVSFGCEQAPPPRKAPDTVWVLVAKKELKSGVILRHPEELFDEREILKASAPANALSKVEDLRDRQLKVARQEGETVSLDQLSEDRKPLGPCDMKLKIHLDPDTTWVVPQCKVDVQWNPNADESKVLLEGVRILGIRYDPLARRDSRGRAYRKAEITVHLSGEEAKIAEAAQKQGFFSVIRRRSETAVTDADKGSPPQKSE